MFPIFHVAVPLALFEIPKIKRKFTINRFSLLIGALFPDIIDKSLLFLGIFSGRGISHTLLFVGIASLILYIISRGNSPVTIPFLIGNVFHLLLDLPYVPIFYPFFDFDFIMTEDPIDHWLYSLFNDPKVYGTELIGIGILIGITISNKLYNFNKIVFYLKTQEMEDKNYNKTN